MLKSAPGNDPAMPAANTIRLVPGILSTTRDPSALGEGQAADLLNCNTARGVWQLDRRYRRFKAAPVRSHMTGGVATYVLAPVAASMVTALMRMGGNRSFASPGNARLSDGVYACASGIMPGDKTGLLHADGFVPGVAIPTSATTLIAHVKVVCQVDPDNGLATEVLDDYLYVTLDGATLGGNHALLSPVGLSDGALEYTINLATLGITPAMLAAGRVGIRWGGKGSPDAPFSAGDWTLTPVATGSSTLDASTVPWSGGTPWGINGTGTNASSIGSVVTTVTYIGAGSAPDYVIISTTSEAEAGTQVLSLNDGQGGVYGSSSSSFDISHTKKRRLGDGQSFTVSMSAAGNGFPPEGV